MRHSVLALPFCLLLTACSSVEYHDTTAAVDARPQCAGMDEDEPNTVLPDWCERTQSATWRLGDEGMPAPDFGGEDDDG